MTPEPEWVDLGLPSGLLWAKANLGATLPESYGIYFSWGNITGHPAGAGYDFSQANYDASPAAAISSDLSLSQDAARTNLGAPWRMPTAAEFQELVNNCTSIWTTMNGVNGRLFTSNVNGNTLFLPASGYIHGLGLSSRGVGGFYWSSTFYSSADGQRLQFNEANINSQDQGLRINGYSVRAVRPA